MHSTYVKTMLWEQPGILAATRRSFRWKGKYSFDLQNRETVDTQLGVFADFDPKLPDVYRKAKLVFLGNIDPQLQLSVLDQVRQPDLVACDTMNFWIEGQPDTLMQLLKRIDVLMVNDAEARQLSGDWNIYRAARWILKRGPRMVIIKQGEYGAVLIDGTGIFHVPAKSMPRSAICSSSSFGKSSAASHSIP